MLMCRTQTWWAKIKLLYDGNVLSIGKYVINRFNTYMAIFGMADVNIKKQQKFHSLQTIQQDSTFPAKVLRRELNLILSFR